MKVRSRLIPLLVTLMSLLGSLFLAPVAVGVVENGPVLAADINTSSAGLGPTFLTEFNGEIYFQGNDGLTGAELWKTDGDTATKVIDLNTESLGSQPYALTVLNSKLYFIAIKDDGSWLYSIDTNDVATPIIKIAESSSNYNWATSLELHAGSTVLFFTKDVNENGTELFKWDPTTNINNAVQISSESSGCHSYPWFINVFEDSALYLGNQDCSSGGIFLYNGNSVTQYSNMDMRAATTYQGKMYFCGFDYTNGSELWSFDGNSIERETNYDGSLEPNNFAVMGGDLYFFGWAGDNYPLFKFDGNNLSVVGDPNFFPMSAQAGTMMATNDKLFMIQDQTDSSNRILTSDGNEISIVADLPEFQFNYWAGFNANTNLPIYALGSLFYSGGDTPGDAELIKINPDTLEVEKTIEINPTNQSSYASGFVTFKNKIYFNAYSTEYGSELWSYDKSGNAELVADINPGERGSYVQYLTVVGEELYFSAESEDYGQEIWSYDGINPPSIAKDIAEGTSSIYPNEFAEFDGHLYFIMDSQVWYLDDSNNPQQIEIEATNIEFWKSIRFLNVFKGNLYFTSDYQSESMEESIYSVLYKYDGINPAAPITDPVTGPRSVYKPLVTPDYIYFRATDELDNFGRELYRYDGTTEPERVTDIASGDASSLAIPRVFYNDLLYFTARPTESENEDLYLYTLDDAGTVEQLSIPSSKLSSVSGGKVLNGTLYLPAAIETESRDQYKYVILKQTGNGPITQFGSSSTTLSETEAGPPIVEMIVFNGNIYLAWNQGSHGIELSKLFANFSKKKQISGFKKDIKTLNPEMKKSIKAFLKANVSATKIKCIGQTAIGKKTAKDKALAKARATAVCTYALSVKPGLKKTVGTAVGKKANKAFNGVLITLSN